jgi:hypothetical protein
MNNEDIQRLLAAANYYNGGIDGDLGEKSLLAISTLLKRHAGMIETNADRWSAKRRAIGAAQLILHFAGYEPGSIDGYAGVNTLEAFRAWNYYQVHRKHEEIDRTPKPNVPAVQSTFPSQAGCNAFYGVPGSSTLISQLAMYDLPLPMRIDYNLSQKSTRVQLHKKCGDSAMSAMREIVKHYGEKEWRRLGLDRNAGTYNHRKMRGGSSWSMHAYGCAWDFYAGPNGLRVPAPKALFSGADYVAFFNIWEAHGWTSLGRAINRDWMHVQAASLK